MCYVSDSGKFIFVRCAKTASTSVIESLKTAYPDVHLENYDWTGDPEHVPLYFFESRSFPEICKRYFKFGFVRNPFDRMVSAFFYSKQCGFNHGIQELRTVQADQYESFDQWIRRDKCVLYGSQYNFLKGCDFIGRMENIQEDMNQICDAIGSKRLKVEHTNATKHDHYSKYYTEESKAIVREKFKKDLEHFEYKF